MAERCPDEDLVLPIARPLSCRLPEECRFSFLVVPCPGAVPGFAEAWVAAEVTAPDAAEKGPVFGTKAPVFEAGFPDLGAAAQI